MNSKELIKIQDLLGDRIIRGVLRAGGGGSSLKTGRCSIGHSLSGVKEFKNIGLCRLQSAERVTGIVILALVKE